MEDTECVIRMGFMAQLYQNSATRQVECIECETYFYSYAGNKIHGGLQPECQIACVCAATKFEEICGKLKEGNIDLYDLQKMKEKQVQLRRLCEALAVQGDQNITLASVSACIEQRLDEFEKFSSRKQAYWDFCRLLPHSIKGIIIMLGYACIQSVGLLLSVYVSVTHVSSCSKLLVSFQMLHKLLFCKFVNFCFLLNPCFRSKYNYIS